MNTLETLATFFGWCAILNIGFLFLALFVLVAMRGTVMRIHAALFGISETELPRIYFQYLAHYQTATLVLAVMPYFALVLMQ